MEPKSPSKLKLHVSGHYRRVLKIGALVLAIVMLVVVLYSAINYRKFGYLSTTTFYAVIIDAGSTGTRINVYEWQTSDITNRDLPVLVHSYPDNSTKSPLWKSGCKYHCMQTEPGLDKFVNNLSAVRASLEPLILWAEQIVPFERHRETPIFLLATAGLRRLSNVDARVVLKDCRVVLKEHSFMYRQSWTRVLDGKEEAYYGWVALNYQMGNFKNSSLRTFGLLDLGGSSLQVVMETDEVRGEDRHFVRSNIGFLEHSILTYSLPAFGLNEAFDRTISMLSRVQPLEESDGDKLELRHPCLGSGFVQNYSCYGCFGLNGTKWNLLRGQKGDNHSGLISLVGDPNWEKCRGLARAVAVNSRSSDWSQLTFGSNCKARNNILNLTVIAHPGQRFHALSGFFAVYNTLNLNPLANLTKIWEKGQELCKVSWSDSSSISKYQNYPSQHCFRVSYLASLIDDAFCLGDTQVIFGPADVSWTLGAALVEANYSWTNLTSASWVKITKFIYLPRVIFPIFVFLLGLVFISYYCCATKLWMASSLPSHVRPKWQQN